MHIKSCGRGPISVVVSNVRPMRVISLVATGHETSYHVPFQEKFFNIGTCFFCAANVPEDEAAPEQC